MSQPRFRVHVRKDRPRANSSDAGQLQSILLLVDALYHNFAERNHDRASRKMYRLVDDLIEFGTDELGLDIRVSD